MKRIAISTMRVSSALLVVFRVNEKIPWLRMLKLEQKFFFLTQCVFNTLGQRSHLWECHQQDKKNPDQKFRKLGVASSKRHFLKSITERESIARGPNISFGRCFSKKSSASSFLSTFLSREYHRPLISTKKSIDWRYLIERVKTF